MWCINDYLAALKLIPNWFDTSKMIKLFAALYADEIMLYFNEDSGDAVFNYNEMSIVNIDLNNTNLDGNFDEEDPNTVILIRLVAWHTKFEKHKELKGIKRKINVGWVASWRMVEFVCGRRWEKKLDSMFIEEL